MLRTRGVLRGEEITTKRSPYFGNIDYRVEKAGRLIFPADLSNDNLVAVEPKGIGRGYPGENGVFITSWEGDGDSGAGNHVSCRLSCRSNL